MNNPSTPRFARGLLIQFLLASAFLALTGNGILGAFAAICSKIFYSTFMFGLLYGFFRLFGAKIDEVDWFYDRFPFGYLAGMRQAPSAEVVAAKPETAARAATSPQAASFNWAKLLSPESLRYAGMLLILSAVFSLLFRIDWDLSQKILASALGGSGLLIIAEILSRRSLASAAATSSLLGFASLQFALSLLGTYASMYPRSGLPLTGEAWLFCKLALTLALLSSVLRYPAKFHSVAYLLVAFIAPFSLMRLAYDVPFIDVGIFLVGMTAVSLWLGWKLERYDLWIIGTIAAGVTTALVETKATVTQENVQIAVGIAGIVFVLHLVMTGWVIARRRTADQALQLNSVLVHASLLLQLYGYSSTYESAQGWPLLNNYLGLAFLASALVPFVIYLLLRQRGISNEATERLANLAIIASSLGLFLETKDPWTAVVFLGFACLVVWYAIRSGTVRTKVYAAVILGLSLLKLYGECSEVFNSIPGNVVIIVLGVLLVLLSHKYEAIKKMVMSNKQ